MDYSLPRLYGATAARMILAKDPAARIVLVSVVPPPAQLAKSGATPIPSKPVELDKLYSALFDAAPCPPSRGSSNEESIESKAHAFSLSSSDNPR